MRALAGDGFLLCWFARLRLAIAHAALDATVAVRSLSKALVGREDKGRGKGKAGEKTGQWIFLFCRLHKSCRAIRGMITGQASCLIIFNNKFLSLI